MDAWELVQYSDRDLAYHSGVVFNNRAILIGGVSNSVTVPWVVQSPDGIHGSILTDTPIGFSARERHASCVFDERIFVSCGINGQTAITDILASEEGIKWESMLDVPVGFYNHRMVAFGNPRVKLVFLGGFNGNEFFNIVTHSSNGRDWDVVTPIGSMWSARSGFGALVCNNKLWIFGGIGGTVGAQQAFDDIWYTDDLVHWHRAVEHAPWGPRCDFGYCEWDERIWVIAGKGNNVYDPRTQEWVVSPVNTVWFSRDGSTWKQAFDFPSTLYHTYAGVINNKIHVFGGVGNEHNVYRMNLG